MCLFRRCLPCSFLRSSINETRVQSRRMSNKYVSYPRPPLSMVQSPPPADYLPSSFSTPALPRRFSSPFFMNLPHTTTDVVLPPHTLTLSRAASSLCPSSLPFGFRRFDPEQNHRSIRAYMLLTALSLPSSLHSA